MEISFIHLKQCSVEKLFCFHQKYTFNQFEFVPLIGIPWHAINEAITYFAGRMHIHFLFEAFVYNFFFVPLGNEINKKNH